MPTSSTRRFWFSAATVLSAIVLGITGGCTSEANEAIREDPDQVEPNAASSKPLQGELVTPGTLTVAVFDASPPSAFYTDDDRLIGWEIELATDLADRLGLQVTFIGGSFESVLNSVESGSADIGIASVFDTQARQERVDFVNYFVGGTSWASGDGSEFSPLDPCGSRVGALAGSAQKEDYLPRVSDQCVNNGAEPITIVSYDSLTSAVPEVAVGRIDAIVADDPVIAFLANQSFGRLSVVETYVEAQPYGVAVAKGKPLLTQQLQSALTNSEADGTYLDLLGRWGLETGAITEFTINGASDFAAP